MNAERLPPLSAELEAILTAERVITPLTGEVRHRALTRARAAPPPGIATGLFRAPPRRARLAVAAGATLLLTAAGAAALQMRWATTPEPEQVAPAAIAPAAQATRVRRPTLALPAVPVVTAEATAPRAPVPTRRRPAAPPPG